MAACMRWCVHLRSILVGVGIGIGYRDLLGGRRGAILDSMRRIAFTGVSSQLH